MENEVKLRDAREIEIQRVHRQPKGEAGKRTIIARFLRYTDVEYILQNAKNLKNTKYVIYQDFPKGILERRKEQMTALRESSKEKKAFFSKTQPDKLYIDGELYTGSYAV